MSDISLSVPSGLQKVIDSGIGGFALQNGTPTIASYTAPNDGNLHRVDVAHMLNVTSAETGGQLSIHLKNAAGVDQGSVEIHAGGLGVGWQVGEFGAQKPFAILPGWSITIQQDNALTAGAAIFYYQIWAK